MSADAQLKMIPKTSEKNKMHICYLDSSIIVVYYH